MLRAAAISKALLAFSCPLTSEKSIIYFERLPVSNSIGASLVIFSSPFKYLITCFRLSTGSISIFFTTAASLAFSFGKSILFIPILAASIHIGRTPFTLHILPPQR